MINLMLDGVIKVLFKHKSVYNTVTAGPGMGTRSGRAVQIGELLLVEFAAQDGAGVGVEEGGGEADAVQRQHGKQGRPLVPAEGDNHQVGVVLAVGPELEVVHGALAAPADPGLVTVAGDREVHAVAAVALRALVVPAGAGGGGGDAGEQGENGGGASGHQYPNGVHEDSTSVSRILNVANCRVIFNH